MDHTPSPELLKAVRVGLLSRNSSLTALAVKNGVKRQNLAAALTGKWTGPKASKLVSAVCAEVLAA